LSKEGAIGEKRWKEGDLKGDLELKSIPSFLFKRKENNEQNRIKGNLFIQEDFRRCG